MTKRFYGPVLVVPLILAVLILGTQVAVHTDGDHHDESHCTCQVCHIAHAAMPQPAAPTQIQAPRRVVRFASPETSASTVESASILSIPRAPPA